MRLLHPARSSSAAKAPLTFREEHFCRREAAPCLAQIAGLARRRTDEVLQSLDLVEGRGDLLASMRDEVQVVRWSGLGVVPDVHVRAVVPQSAYANEVVAGDVIAPLRKGFRHGSRRTLSCLLAFVLGLGLIIASAIIGSTVGTVVGALLFAAGYAGSRPGFSWL
jgi:hypothetical protein